MGRHEIRLRRQQMTSRRIQRHKNYAGLLEQHKRTERVRSIVRWVIYLLMFLMGLMIVYGVVNFNKSPEKVNMKNNDIENTSLIIPMKKSS